MPEYVHNSLAVHSATTLQPQVRVFFENEAGNTYLVKTLQGYQDHLLTAAEFCLTRASPRRYTKAIDALGRVQHIFDQWTGVQGHRQLPRPYRGDVRFYELPTVHPGRPRESIALV